MSTGDGDLKMMIYFLDARLNGIRLDSVPYKAASGNTHQHLSSMVTQHVLKYLMHLEQEESFTITITGQPEDVTYDHSKR